MKQAMLVGAGGFVGAMFRYMIIRHVPPVGSAQLPAATLIVNVIGCFIMGIIMTAAVKTNLISADMQLFLTTGILGGLTAYSSLCFETISYFNTERYLLGGCYICINVLAGLSAVRLGQWLMTILMKLAR